MRSPLAGREVRVERGLAAGFDLGQRVLQLAHHRVVAPFAEHEVERPIFPVDVADTVGAGDSFTAALLAALDDRTLLGAENRERLHTMDLHDIQSVLIFASRASAITASRPGADPPWRHEVAG